MANVSNSSMKKAMDEMEYQILKDQAALDKSSTNIEENNKNSQKHSKDDAEKEEDEKVLSNDTNDDASTPSASTSSNGNLPPQTAIAQIVKILEKHLLAAKKELINVESDDSSQK